MISRLHNFDGSYTEPDQVHFLKYMEPSVSGLAAPVVVDGAQTNYTAAKAMMDSFKKEDNPGHDVILANFGYTDPVEPVPALQHYRLIYESKTRTTPADMPDVRYVKIFEYVPGAILPGEGVLELDVRTNTGREFVYRTTSVNGTFILPYPTETTVGAVTIPGQYRNVKSGASYPVSEEQVTGGHQVS